MKPATGSNVTTHVCIAHSEGLPNLCRSCGQEGNLAAVAQLQTERNKLQAENEQLCNTLDEIKDYHSCHDCQNYKQETGKACCDPTVRMINKAQESK